MKKTLLFISSILITMSCFSQSQNFEIWTADSIENLDDHETTIDEIGALAAPAIYPSTDAHSGALSVRLESVYSSEVQDTLFGFFISGDPQTLTPGQATPFNGVDSIIGYYKYDIQTGDSVTFIASTTASSFPTGGGIFYIPSGTQTTWKRFGFEINATFSDSLIFGSSTGDPLNGWKGKPGSWIQFDDIQLKKGNQVASVENGGFENWTGIVWENPAGWTSSNEYAIFEPVLPAVKTTDMNSGNFALELNTITNSNGDTINGLATNGTFDQNGIYGGEPYAANPTGIEFYYKNTVSGTDTAWVSAEFFNGGSSVGAFGSALTPTSTYTLFTQSFTLSMPCDTVLLGAFSGENPGSQLYIDDIDFTFPIGISENLEVSQLISYPNPATDEIKIKFDLSKSGSVAIRLIDISGKELTLRNLGNLSEGTYREVFNTSSFASGTYLIEFTLGKEKIVERFIVK